MNQKSSHHKVKISTIAILLTMSVSAFGARQASTPRLHDEITTESDMLRLERRVEPRFIEGFVDPKEVNSFVRSQIEVLDQYSHLDPNHLVPDQLLKDAVLYYDANLAKIKNRRYLSVIDFSKRSTVARFFIINMSSGSVWAIHTSHGKGSDPEHDGWVNSNLLSNVSGSNASSQGYYLTAETYYGGHGLSLRLDGLSSTNSNARSRLIVIHGASYVKEATVIQGRSFGCPAVAEGVRDQVIAKLKGGSLIYAGLSPR